MSKNRDLGNYGSAALIDADTLATPNTAVKRTAEGKVKTADAADTDDAVAFGQLGTAAQRDVMTSLTDTTTPDALMPRGAFGLGTFFQSLQLPAIADHHVVVIGLIDVTNTDIGKYSAIDCEISFSRSNGVEPPITIKVLGQKAYNTADAYIKIQAMPNNVLAPDLTGIRACLFTYNGVRYAGIRFYTTAAGKDVNIIKGRFDGNVTPFLVPYFNQATSTTLNSEIAGSINQVQNSTGRVFDQTNIVGNVNQYLGIPTGAVIEQGSNATGKWVKFADGSAYWWKTVNFGATTIYAAASGNAYTTYAADINAPLVLNESKAWITAAQLYTADNKPIYTGIVYESLGARIFHNGALPEAVYYHANTFGSAVATQGAYSVAGFGRWF